jgi:hypothetical protein
MDVRMLMECFRREGKQLLMAAVIQRLSNKTNKSLQGFTMKFQGRAQPVGYINPRRIAKHFVGQSAGLAAAALIGFCQPVGRSDCDTDEQWCCDRCD